ncbi:MAG TPA: hypothetical protein VGE21_11550 [Flavobacteriales bacterium]
MRSVTVRRPEAPIRATIALPRSKSVANRALVLAALAGDIGCVENAGDADDTRILLRLLKELPRVMHCGEGGTTFRFLLAWACVQEGQEHVLTGTTRLLERPHDALVDALRELGADITRTEEGYRVIGKRLVGGAITIDSPVSSQFISALLLVAPCFEQGLRLTWTGRRLSEPYVHMTLEVLKHFGVLAEVDNGTIHVPSTPLRPAPITIPRDWSAAAFWFQITALADDAEVMLEGLHTDGWQGDEEVRSFMRDLVDVDVLQHGCMLRTKAWSGPESLRFELQGSPDLFQPLVLTWVGVNARVAFGGLHNLPLKETDRIAAVAHALAHLGVSTSFNHGVFSILTHGPLKPAQGHAFGTSNDHRMAMSLAPLALVLEEVTILDPDVVGKSYPRYWEDLRKAGFILEFRDK